LLQALNVRDATCVQHYCTIEELKAMHCMLNHVCRQRETDKTGDQIGCPGCDVVGSRVQEKLAYLEVIFTVISTKQQSPAVADKPARRESIPKIAPI